MKKLTAFLLLFSGSLAAQNDSLRSDHHHDFSGDSTEHNSSFIKVISVSVGGGAQIIRTGFQDVSVIQQAAPSSSLAFADLSQYGNGGLFSGIFGNFNSGSTKGIAVNVRFGCQKKFSETRFGIYHSTIGITSQNYSLTSSVSIDTTAVPGGTFVTDSIFTSSYNYNWYSDVISLEASWIARTNPARIVSFYTGFGMNFGAGFNGVIENSFVENTYFMHYGTGDVTSTYMTGYTTRTDIQERFRAPGFFFTTANIPVGMNIRLGRRNPILRHIVLHYEYQGQLQMLFPSGIDAQVRTASAFTGGVKWLIHPPKVNRGHGWKNNHRHHE
ncbi:MAG: hypothetical protein RL007_2180 [Bacteroidota bacterium]|jgi:hypothetical protein